mgnify:FL=1
MNNPFGSAIPSSKRIVFVSGEDWTGVYLNGRLLVQNSSILAKDILKHLGYEIEDMEVDQEWLEDQGELPIQLKNIPKGNTNV